MNTLPDHGAGDENRGSRGDIGGSPAFDPVDVYRQLQQACRALEMAEEHATAAYVAHAMAIIHDRYGVGRDHRDED